MSDGIVNLNKARKAKDRAEAAARAARNRAAHGLTKAQKQAARDAVAKADSALDGHLREP